MYRFVIGDDRDSAISFGAADVSQPSWSMKEAVRVTGQGPTPCRSAAPTVDRESILTEPDAKKRTISLDAIAASAATACWASSPALRLKLSNPHPVECRGIVLTR